MSRRLALIVLLATPAAFAQWEGTATMKFTSPDATGTGTVAVGPAGARAQLDIHAEEAAKNGAGDKISMVTLWKAGNPDVVFLINDADKTFSVIDTTANKRGAKVERARTYKVEPNGNDVVAGFACRKATVTPSEGDISEVCVSKEILGAPGLLASFERRRGTGARGMMKALTDAQITGMPVRWIVKDRNDGKVKSTMELTSAKKETVPASTFEVPAGYKKTEGPAMHMSPAQRKQMDEALDKLSPEERKAYEQMMKSKSGGGN